MLTPSPRLHRLHTGHAGLVLVAHMFSVIQDATSHYFCWGCGKAAGSHDAPAARGGLYSGWEKLLGAHVATSLKAPRGRLPFNGALLHAW